MGLPGHQPGLNNLVQSLVCEGLPGVLSSKLSRTSHLMGWQQHPGGGVWEVHGPRPPCASGQQPHQDRKARKVSVCIQTEQHRSRFFCFLFFFFSPGERESSRSKSEKQRSFIYFSLPCASPGAGLYFLFSVIISVSHLIIKTLKEIIFCFYPDSIWKDSLSLHRGADIFM